MSLGQPRASTFLSGRSQGKASACERLLEAKDAEVLRLRSELEAWRSKAAKPSGSSRRLHVDLSACMGYVGAELKEDASVVELELLRSVMCGVAEPAESSGRSSASSAFGFRRDRRALCAALHAADPALAPPPQATPDIGMAELARDYVQHLRTQQGAVPSAWRGCREGIPGTVQSGCRQPGGGVRRCRRCRSGIGAIISCKEAALTFADSGYNCAPCRGGCVKRLAAAMSPAERRWAAWRSEAWPTYANGWCVWAQAPQSERFEQDDLTPLMYAVFGGQLETLELLLQSKAEVNHQNNTKCTALMLAADLGHTSSLKRLLTARADVSLQASDSTTALTNAAQKGHQEVVEELLCVGQEQASLADALWWAAEYGHASIVERLFHYKVDPNLAGEDGSGPAGGKALRIAAHKNNGEVISALLAGNVDVNATSANGFGALAVACQYGSQRVAQDLLANAADVNARAPNGRTPLMNPGISETRIASTFGHSLVVEHLLIFLANVHMRDREGNTPLLLAAQSGHIRILQALLQQNAQVNAAGQCGWTALNLAASFGHLAACQLLLSHKADAQVPDEAQETPEMAALAGGHTEIVALRLGRMNLLGFFGRKRRLQAAQVASPCSSPMSCEAQQLLTGVVLVEGDIPWSYSESWRRRRGAFNFLKNLLEAKVVSIQEPVNPTTFTFSRDLRGSLMKQRAIETSAWESLREAEQLEDEVQLQIHVRHAHIEEADEELLRLQLLNNEEDTWPKAFSSIRFSTAFF
eukprot:g11898.t2